MHGFFGSYGQAVHWDFSSLSERSFVTRRHDEKGFHLTQLTLPVWLDDKYFTEAEDCFLAVEGVLLEASPATEAIHQYKNGNICFWDSWRGSFMGVLYDAQTDTLLLFNDHTGSKILFYTQTQEGLVFASCLRTIAQATNAHSLNNDYARSILDIGCNGDYTTFVDGIFRLTAGQYLLARDRQIQIRSYHTFDNTPWPYDETAMIKETNRLFRQAVSRVIKKNEKEGLKHFYPLSGGLDSRITQWIARQLTQQPITNFTYSQTGHYDHLLPQEISKALGNKWQFLALDGGEYIMDVDGVCADTEWLVNYMIPIEPYYFAKQQDWQQIGVILTGLNGDNIFATETDNAHEMARIYTRGFNGYSLGSPLIMQHYTESYSPFCDVDVLDYVLHIPTVKRRNYYFYDRFVMTCYPEVAQWHHKYMRIGHRPAMVTIAGRNIPVQDLPKRITNFILRKLHLYEGDRAEKGVSMNPYDYWVKENPAIDAYMQTYYTRHMDLLADSGFSSICREKMRIGNVMDKGKVLTIQSAIEHLHLTTH